MLVEFSVANANFLLWIFFKLMPKRDLNADKLTIFIRTSCEVQYVVHGPRVEIILLNILPASKRRELKFFPEDSFYVSRSNF